MKKLIKNPDKYYKPAVRPSGHNIGKSFGNDNGGAIPSNLISISNSESNSKYMAYCKLLGIKGHPARFPSKLPEFFINFLTDENDTVLDIFSGSNTTGEAAERNNRKWLSFEKNESYVANSAFRFLHEGYSEIELKKIYDSLINGESLDLSDLIPNENTNKV